MKTTVNLLISIVVAFWIMAIAIVSVQNATPVTLRFLTFESIQIPFGLVLAFCVGLGMIVITLLQPVWGISSRQSTSRRYEDDAEFFVDEDF